METVKVRLILSFDSDYQLNFHLDFDQTVLRQEYILI